MTHNPSKTITRRDLLRGMGATSIAAAVSPLAVAPSADIVPVDAASSVSTSMPLGPLEALTAGESDTLDAIVARIIPDDAVGPGAREARAARYIDRALGGALAQYRQAYTDGLAAIDRFARASYGPSFHELPVAEQDALLVKFERGAIQDFAGASAFFELVRTHTIEGTFSDPFYGGNADFVGWDLIGYPGVRTLVTPNDQRMSVPPVRVHRSAYDGNMFDKASTDALPDPEASDGRHT